MILYRPIKTNLVTQLFGENKSPIYKEMGMLGHNGIDFACPYKEPIYWNCFDYEGEVLNHHIDSAGGIGIDIIVKDPKVYKLRFWHLVKDGYMPKIGTILSTGDLIGYADNTGRSTGNHLHFGIKPQILDKNGNYKNKLARNGYTGGIDPVPFFKNTYIMDCMDNLAGQLNYIQKAVNLIKKLLKGRNINLIRTKL